MTDTPKMPASMNLRTASEYVGCLPSTLREQVYNGKLRAKKKGRDYFVTRREVERYIAESAGRRQPKP